ncbi:gfo/Idh/MocA family oxidoreductase [Lachnospiraceae bacterium AM48-27BH]|nr:gfo/Idh/MocA family oxidoreductase [Lachnospiraceae bacterium AM48-27BH]
MENVRYGVIGIGNMGTSHSGWLAGGKIPGATLTAVCDIDEKRRAWAKENLPEVAVFEDYKELLDSKLVDAVIIAVPHYLHPEMAIESLKRNINTMVEKPAGVYASQIREMNAEAEKHPDVKFAMMFNQRTNPLYQKVKEILDAGTIGELRRVTWIITSWWRTQKYYDSSAWRATWAGEGGGVLVNQAPHQLDLLQWLCGMPSLMEAHLKYGSHRDITVEDDVTAYFEYPNGATGTFITCTHDALGTDRLEIHGDNGKIIITDSKCVTVKKMDKPEDVWNHELDFRQMLALVKGQTQQKLYTEETFECPENWDQQHIDVLINFTNAIAKGEELIAPGAEGIKAVEIANAMFLSDWLGHAVTIPVDDELFYEKLQEKVQEEKNRK